MIRDVPAFGLGLYSHGLYSYGFGLYSHGFGPRWPTAMSPNTLLCTLVNTYSCTCLLTHLHTMRVYTRVVISAYP